MGITYGNGMVVAAGYTSGCRIATSADYYSTTSRWTFDLVNESGGNTIFYYNNMFVAGGEKGKMATSPDGTTWTAVMNSTFGTDEYIRGITYGNGKFVAVGDKGKMATSENGTTWTAVANSTFGTDTIRAITYGNGKFVAVGINGKIAYLLDD